MKVLKFHYKVQATYKARKNAKSLTVQQVTAKCSKSVNDAINKAATLLGLKKDTPVQWRIISVNNTPFHLVNL